MSLHIMYDHQCSKCEAYYIPYEKDVICPNCGNNEEDIYNIVPEIAQSAQYQMKTMGFYTPIAWWTGSFGDYVALIIFKILDDYTNQKEEKDFKSVATEYCNNRTWGNQLYMKDHICDLSHKVYLELQKPIIQTKRYSSKAYEDKMTVNYQVKYSITRYTVKNKKVNIAIIGAYDINHYKHIEDNISYLEKNLDKEIILESHLRGDPSVPMVEKSIQIAIEDHENKLKNYISNIKEDTIIMFSNKDPYGLIPINILESYAKELNKKIICISIGPCRFQGKRINSNFSYLWDKIESQANEAILIDCNLDDNEIKSSKNTSEIELILFDRLLKRIYSLVTE